MSKYIKEEVPTIAEIFFFLCFLRIAGSETSGRAVGASVVLLFYQPHSPQVAIKEVILHFPPLNCLSCFYACLQLCSCKAVEISVL